MAQPYENENGKKGRICKFGCNTQLGEFDTIVDGARLLDRLPSQKKNRISARLGRALKGVVSSGYIRTVCRKVNSDWLGPQKSGAGRGQKSDKSRFEKLTRREEEYVQAHENQRKRDRLAIDLIHQWSGKSIAEQGGLIGSVPNGSSFGKVLAEASEQHMFKLSKQMTDVGLDTTMYDIRTLRALGDKFRDVLYEERELRKRNKDIGSV